jgi:L-asparaginase II
MNGSPRRIVKKATVQVLRGDVVESVHHASIAVVNLEGTLVHQAGRPSLVSFMRSAAKPFQALPFLETGAADAFGFRDEEVALAVASHNGESRHVKRVASMLDAIGARVDDLQCGRHAPFHKGTAEALGDATTALHHNCSGKHAAMLATCLHNGWDTRTYLEPEHPLQRAILKALASNLGLRTTSIGLATDGCGVPCFAVPLHAAALGFAHLARPQEAPAASRQSLARIQKAMAKHPDLVAGDDRLDTHIARATDGRVLVKSGAEAFYGASLLDSGQGLALKIEDGTARAVAPLLIHTLSQLGALDESATKRLAEHVAPEIRNYAGRLVGRIQVASDT